MAVIKLINYDQLYEVLQAVKTYIDHSLTSYTEALRKAIQDTKNYVDDAINSVDVTEQLKEYAKLTDLDGLFDDVALNEAEMNAIKNLDDFFKDDVILIPTYGGFLEGAANLELYISNDAKTCYNVNPKPLFSSFTGKALWDYSILYHNNKFFLLTDYKRNDDSWGGNAFNLITTEDFVNFEEFSFSFKDVDNTIDQTWAPEFLVHNGEVYIFYSMQKNGETYVGSDLNKAVQPFNRTYYSKALNDDLTSWSAPTLLKMPTDVCRIDPCVVYEKELFHLFVCADDKAEIEHFTATSIDTTWTYVNTVPFPARTEAPAVIKFKDKYYLFVDSHRGSGGNAEGFYHVAESDDLTNWSNVRLFKNQSRLKMRHFTPLVLSADEEKEVIKNLFNKLNNNQGDSVLTTYSYIDKAKEKRDMCFVDLASLVDDSCVINELKVCKNTLYYLNGIDKTIRINKINIDYLNNFDEFYFMVNTIDSKTKLVLANSCTGSSTIFLHQDYFTIGGVAKNSWVSHGFFARDGRIRHIGTPIYSNHADAIPFNFLANGDFSKDLDGWYARQGATLTVSDEHIDSGEKSCRVTGDETGAYQGLAQNIQLLPNTFYNFSCYFLTKDKESLHADGVVVEIKGVKEASEDEILAKKQINRDNIYEYYWTKLNLTLNTSNIDLDEYTSFYVYFYLSKGGDVFVTKFNLCKDICN